MRRTLLTFVGGVVLVAGCNLSARALAWKVPVDAAMMTAVSSPGELEDPRLGESSGLTPSGRRPGVFWTLNDSGNDPDLFAIDTAGRAVQHVRVSGAPNADWEALSAGPCPEGACLYIGDVGDNLGTRDHVTVWRLPEPRAGQDSVGKPTRLDVRYADGPRDVEAIYVSPDTALWFITKRPLHRFRPSRSPVRVYRVAADAWRAGGIAVAERVGTLPIIPGQLSVRDWVTDAALSSAGPDGAGRLAVLTYGAVHVFVADPASGRPGGRVASCALPILERDAEAIAWLPDGRLLLTNEDRGSRVYAGRCP